MFSEIGSAAKLFLAAEAGGRRFAEGIGLLWFLFLVCAGGGNGAKIPV
jgi:hypothetical protein